MNRLGNVYRSLGGKISRKPFDTPNDKASGRAGKRRPPLVVGVGASAGGLDAYRAFFAKMAVDSGMAFVVIQHLAPDHKSMLAEILARSTSMPVAEAFNDTPVEANHVYVIPPDATMTIAGGRLKLVQPAPPRELRRPIDSFLQSLAEDQGEQAIGIILSGTGSDGAQGMVAIKEHGGLTLAQAEYDHQAMAGMPQSADATGQVDDVLAVEDMPARLIAHRMHLEKIAGAKKEGNGARTDTASHLSTIMAALRARSGHDFGAYKEKTLVRRVQRRMQVLQLADPADYIKHYGDHPEELDLLFAELLIGVTEFFRDPAAFEALDETVLKNLVSDRGADEDIRVWVPACATGQEAFSIAIQLREAMDVRRPRPRIQIFATDIDPRAIADARLGRFRLPVAGLSPERLDRWFTCEGKLCSVVPEIREMCVFSVHSLIKDPPFAKLDLISCRNLLIYLDPTLQDRVMRTFHYSLKPGGKLFLGLSESVTRATRLFGVKDKKHRIFERLVVEGPSLPDLAGSRRTPMMPAPPSRPSASGDRIDKGARRTMEKYYPPHIVVDRKHQIVRFSGGAMGRYLEPSPGAPSFALFDMLRKPLRAAVRDVLQQAQASGAPVVHDNILIRAEGGARLVTLIAEPLSEADGGSDYIVLAFQDGGPAADGKAVRRGKDGDERHALEQELLTTRSQLQSTIDELESANEEMKSSNEEYQSVNEELQSSNEELETSKEEMQSINEELQTINAEMASKNEQLTRLNSDIANLLESTEIATMFLDEHLRLKNFTRGVTDIFHVRETDIGRPITEIVSVFDYADMRKDVKKVLRTLAVVEREVRLADGSMCFALRVRPYRTVDNVISGVVMTFVDVTERQAADDALRASEKQFRALFDAIDEGFCTIEKVDTRPGQPSDFRYVTANPAFAAQAGVGDVVGKTIRQAFPGEAQEWFDIYDEVLRSREAIRFDRPLATQDRYLELFAFPLDDMERRQLAVIFADVSDRHRSEEQQSLLLKELDHRVKNLFAIMSGVVTLSARGAANPKDLADKIHGRLNALASAHLLIRAEKSADEIKRTSTIGKLVATVLAPYLDPYDEEDGKHVRIDGPEVAIGGESVTSLALVIHELATNAAKYGALSVPGGVVRISWAIDRGQLKLTWQERGGPTIKGEPTSEGFGSKLARRSVNGQLGGKLAFDWHSDGLTVRLSAPEERLTR